MENPVAVTALQEAAARQESEHRTFGNCTNCPCLGIFRVGVHQELFNDYLKWFPDTGRNAEREKKKAEEKLKKTVFGRLWLEGKR